MDEQVFHTIMQELISAMSRLNTQSKNVEAKIDLLLEKVSSSSNTQPKKRATKAGAKITKDEEIELKTDVEPLPNEAEFSLQVIGYCQQMAHGLGVTAHDDIYAQMVGVDRFTKGVRLGDKLYSRDDMLPFSNSLKQEAPQTWELLLNWLTIATDNDETNFDLAVVTAALYAVVKKLIPKETTLNATK